MSLSVIMQVIETKRPPVAAIGRCLVLNKLLLVEITYLIQKGICSWQQVIGIFHRDLCGNYHTIIVTDKVSY